MHEAYTLWVVRAKRNDQPGACIAFSRQIKAASGNAIFLFHLYVRDQREPIARAARYDRYIAVEIETLIYVS